MSLKMAQKIISRKELIKQIKEAQKDKEWVSEVKKFIRLTSKGHT